MSKYRIVEVREEGAIHYNVEKKGWFFWYTEEHYVGSELGTSSWSTRFESQDVARTYIAVVQAREKARAALAPTKRTIVETYG